jgi:dihydrofolate reductase
MKTQYYTASSLDGFIATEDHSLDWLFSLGEVGESSYPAFIAEVGALAMGSGTYEWLLRNADKVAEATGSAWPYTQPVWVFTSRELPKIKDAKIYFVKGDVRDTHQTMRIAAGNKNIWIVGGGDLAGQFYDAELLDELIVQVGSVTLGKGKPLLPREITGSILHLTSAHQMGGSMIELRYQIIKKDS